jgi:hypothetical protein
LRFVYEPEPEPEPEPLAEPDPAAEPEPVAILTAKAFTHRVHEP